MCLQNINSAGPRQATCIPEGNLGCHVADSVCFTGDASLTSREPASRRILLGVETQREGRCGERERGAG